MYKENKIKLLKSISGIAIGILLILQYLSAYGGLVQIYPMISRAMYGTRLKTMTKILNNPMKETNIMLNSCLEIEKNLLFIR